MRRIRAVLPTTPVISHSGYDTLANQYDPQPDAFLLKGGGVKQMLGTLQRLLAQNDAIVGNLAEADSISIAV